MRYLSIVAVTIVQLGTVRQLIRTHAITQDIACGLLAGCWLLIAAIQGGVEMISLQRPSNNSSCIPGYTRKLRWLGRKRRVVTVAPNAQSSLSR